LCRSGKVALVDAPPDLLITMSDVTRAGYCARGARRWFEGHGLDFRAFMKDGIPAAEISALDDALGNRVVATAQERRA
jgi:hypothetical protein